jgi:MoaA/NifB/PqqE/SkfB family radical SAM enzyme
MLNSIAIITTLKCDLKCEHCLRGYPKVRPDFPMELLDKLLSEVMPLGVCHVGLTGGEPCLHPQFEQMVEKLIPMAIHGILSVMVSEQSNICT